MAFRCVTQPGQVAVSSWSAAPTSLVPKRVSLPRWKDAMYYAVNLSTQYCRIVELSMSCFLVYIGSNRKLDSPNTSWYETFITLTIILSLCHPRESCREESQFGTSFLRSTKGLWEVLWHEEIEGYLEIPGGNWISWDSIDFLRAVFCRRYEIANVYFDESRLAIFRWHITSSASRVPWIWLTVASCYGTWRDNIANACRRAWRRCHEIHPQIGGLRDSEFELDIHTLRSSKCFTIKVWDRHITAI